jgi:hypothetical protein
MKKIIFFLFLCISLFANIDSQIEAIQKAPVAERFKLMNAFKKKIIQMQEKERIQAMSKLQSITQSKHADKAFKELRNHANVRQSKIHRNTREQHLRPEIHQEESTQEHVENEVEEQTENETEEHEEEEHDDD